MIDKYDEHLEILFLDYMMGNTLVFMEIKHSVNGKGSNVFNKILEIEGQLCYIPTGNACSWKGLEYI